MAGGNYGALVIALGLLFGLAFIVNVTIAPYLIEGEYNQDSIIAPIIDFMNDGITVGGITILNPFNWLGDAIKEFVITQFSAFSYIPNIVSIPLLIFIIVLLIYGLVKMATP